MDIEEIKKTLNVFRTDNGLIEIRVFNTINGNENYSGIFNNEESLINEVQRFDKEPYNTYFVFNELKDAMSGRPQFNKLLKGVSAVKDPDIKYRRWLFLDFDPIREGGVKDIASTEEEMKYAHLKAVEVYRYLMSIGFPKPIVCKSGNGFHELFRIDNWDNSEEIDKEFSDFLNYISMRFTDSKVDCDIKNKNASRLTKFYSSKSRKGGDTQERPHRYSKIISIPENIEYLSYDVFKSVVNEYRKINNPEPIEPKINNSQYQRGVNKKPFDIDEFLSVNGIEVLKEERLSDKSRKIVLKTCPFHPEHGKDSAIYVSDKGIVFTCFHSGCQGNTWRDLRLKFDPHAYDYENAPRQQYQPQGRYMQPQKKKYQIKEESPELGKKWFSMSDIKKVDLSSLMHIKTGYTELDKKIVGLYEGEISLISGSNSSGKSSWINNLILNVIQQNIKVALWSGELRPDVLKTWISLSAAGMHYIQPSKTEGKFFVPNNVSERIDNWMDGKFFLYNNDYTNKWEQIFNDMKELVKLDVKLFILDNLFSLDIDIFEGDKNNKQKELILQLCDFVKKNKIHIILVAHPRKVTTFLRKTDISGTSDLTNAASNVFIVHRVNNDFLKTGGEFLGDTVVQQYSMFGNCIEIAKNRLYGVVDCLVGMYYEIPTRRFKNTEHEDIHYGWEDQPTQQSLTYEQPQSDLQNFQQQFNNTSSGMPFAPSDGDEAPF